MWTGNAFTGQRMVLEEPGLSNDVLAINDQVSSVKNRWPHVAILYEHSDGDGEQRCLEHGMRIRYLSNISFNDIISSTRLTRSQDRCPA